MNIFLVNTLLMVTLFFILKYIRRYKIHFINIIIGLMIFMNLSILLTSIQLKDWDAWIYQFFVTNMSANMTIFMKHMTNLGSVYILVFITFVIYLLTWIKNKKAIIYGRFIAINLLTVWLINNTLKLLFERERPNILRLVEVSDFSFPSGHAMVGICFYGFLLYLILRNSNSRLIKMTSVCIITFIILMIGISRIYLGVHYASDVLAGFGFGWVWMFSMIIVMEQYYLWSMKKMIGKILKI